MDQCRHGGGKTGRWKLLQGGKDRVLEITQMKQEKKNEFLKIRIRVLWGNIKHTNRSPEEIDNGTEILLE